jgi:hypothetical protein
MGYDLPKTEQRAVARCPRVCVADAKIVGVTSSYWNGKR